MDHAGQAKRYSIQAAEILEGHADNMEPGAVADVLVRLAQVEATLAVLDRLNAGVAITQAG